MMRYFLALALMLPLPAAALDLQCIFDIECFETEGCDMTAYSMDLTLDGGEVPFAVVADTDAETLSGTGFDQGDGFLLRLSSEVGNVMISIDQDGFARQSVHFSGEAMMVNYTGFCEVAN